MSIKAVLTASLLVVTFACGGPNARTGRNPARVTTVARPLEVYQQLGFMAGPPDFPAVASLATMAGPHDSTFVLFALSMPATALRFQRDSTGFVGEYRINISFLKDSIVVKRVEHQERVRVASFAETGRTEESVIFQDLIALPPGTYGVQVYAGDVFSSRSFRARDSVDVPAYNAERKLAAPVIVYRAEGRRRRGARPDLIVNTRNTVPYGNETPHVYLELYQSPATMSIQLRIVNDRNEPVWQRATTLTSGSDSLRYAIVDVPTGQLPLGRLWLEASIPGASGSAPVSAPVRSPLLITISDQWVVANFDDVLRFINYIALPSEVDSLRSATEAERLALWQRFWDRRDPLTTTALNEFREEFFQRVRFATDHFSEGGTAGWDTDRGEVYIVLGPPDQTFDRYIGRDAANDPNAIEWVYDNAQGLRLQLTFIDQTGLGRFELSPQSDHSFRSAANRLKPKGGDLSSSIRSRTQW